MENVMVIGSGGREHAVCWKLSESPKVNRILSCPGSYGIGQLKKVQNISLDVNDHEVLIKCCKENDIKMVVVGPEVPLANGIADALQKSGINCFGPKSSAAQIEADKKWSKNFMVRHNIPTAKFASFDNSDEAKKFIESATINALVVKASGLAAGKGVIVATDIDEALSAVDMMMRDNKLGSAGDIIVVEELLEGEEISVLGFSDGKTVKVMLPSQDHKRVFNGDNGPNTGGMGAYCPCPLIDEEQLEWVRENILQKTVDGMREDGCPFVGVLYAGLMITKDGIKVLEFNCRFGDPEAEVILPLLESDLYEVMKACCEGSLEHINLEWSKGVCTVGVVMCSRGYPETASKGDVIKGMEVNRDPGIMTFHCGIAKKGDDLVTNGGRVLINVCISNSLITAAAKATGACKNIKFDGCHFRKDIAHKAIPRWLMSKGCLSYKASGVDIKAGDDLVGAISPACKQTLRSGVISSLGGFGALFDLVSIGFKNPILVSGTDGVGTKLKIAKACKIHSSIGIDLVAMCVNDILCHGAEPLFFLDYFACGKLDVERGREVICSIAKACKMAGCALIGGETAEMPGLYKDGDYDLAGFAVGAVEKDQQLPRIKDLSPGDVVIGLSSSGLHSNGFSLVRKVMANLKLDYDDDSPFSDGTIGEELLTPTAIYVSQLLPILKKGLVKSLAHITGGGLLENIPRVLRDDLKVVLDAKKWMIPKVYPWLAASGGINERELLRTFNCGVGMVLIVSEEHKRIVVNEVPNSSVIGEVQVRKEGEEQVFVENFTEAITPMMKPYVKYIVKRAANVKRIGVLISGNGTNLQAMINNIQAGNIEGEIVVVISNKAKVQGLERAEKAGIPTKVIPHGDYQTRQQFEEAIQEELIAKRVELVVLAGFMRVLTEYFVSRWRGALINIHPALLPSFKGVNAWQQALDAGVRISGCTVHFVEVDIDAGAIITQEAVNVDVKETLASLQDKIRSSEQRALPKAVQLICSGKCRLDVKTGKIGRAHV